MLIQFTIDNYKCFKQEAKLSLVASGYDKDTRWSDNVLVVPDFQLNLLKSAVIYGANASGKSKFVQAIDFFKYFILKSSKESQLNETIEVEPFKFNTSTTDASTTFEIMFIHENAQFRYGFEVNSSEIIGEWLFFRPETKEIELFYREKQEFSVHKTKFKVGNYLVKNGMVRANALLLSVAGQFNDKTAIKIFNWLKKLDIVSGLHSELYTGVSVHQLKNELQKKEILEFIKAADLGIDDLSPQLLDPDNLPKDLPTELTDLLKKTFKENKNAEFFYDIMTNHKVYNDDNEFIKYTKLSMKADESEGTKKYFALSGLILDALQTGKILVIDELDAKLHPNLVSKLVELFNSKDKNRHGAQLIFNTHDTNLLSAKLFRRDQIWFTEKDRYGAVTLYSLHDFMLEDGDKVRKGADFETNYIKGRYGAIPYLNNFEYLLAI